MAPRSHHKVERSQDIVCKNRFEVFTNLEEDSIENLCSQLQHNAYCDTRVNETHSTCITKRVQHADKVIQKDNGCNVNVDSFKGNNPIELERGKHTSLNGRGDTFGNMNSKSDNGNKYCNAIDYTDTDFIVSSTLHGKSYVKKVNVYKLDKKCEDLTNCLRQQNNAMGFLPINNLNRTRFASSLKPNSIVSEKDFCPIRVHKAVRATGKHNFEEAKILLPSNINFEKFEQLAIRDN